MVGAQLHSLVDILHRGNAGLNQADGLVDHGDQDLVDHEAGSLSNLNGILADLLRQLVDDVEGLLSGVGTADDLHKLHAGNGIEEVHADDGVLEAVAHLGDRQRGGVGSEDGLGLAQFVQLAEQLLFGGHIFLDALDDQIGVSAGGLLLHQDVGQQSIHSLLGHLALGHAFGQRSSQLILVLLSGSHRACIHQGSVALSRENLSNAAAHGAGAENRYFHVIVLL